MHRGKLPRRRRPRKSENVNMVLLFLLAVGCYLNTLMNRFVYDDE